MPILFDHQIKGAEFLASRRVALLADEQRVGKTAAAIRACDYALASDILVITKSSARAQWGREFRVWGFPRRVQVIYSGTERVRDDAQVVVVGWGMVYNPALWQQLMKRRWAVIIPDECHEAKNMQAKRTQALYGHAIEGGRGWSKDRALVSRADNAWPLSGTPVPNAPNDLYPLLRSLTPERLQHSIERKWPDVTRYDAFVQRYCVVVRRMIAGRMIEVIKGGKNLDELRARLNGLWLRRTQKDVGIREPIYSVLALTPGTLPPELGSDVDAADILAAAQTGETAALEMHLGPLRRITGEIKAHAVVDAVREQLADGLDKIVLMAWHTSAIDILRDGLSSYGVVGIDGRTPPTRRDGQAQAFQNDPLKRVFVGQIQAAGEAIDLSASAELWFVEPSFTPMHMAQASKRITNHTQKRQALVRVCALEGSIDEALMTILARKVETIRQVMQQ